MIENQTDVLIYIKEPKEWMVLEWFVWVQCWFKLVTSYCLVHFLSMNFGIYIYYKLL